MRFHNTHLYRYRYLWPLSCSGLSLTTSLYGTLDEVLQLLLQLGQQLVHPVPLLLLDEKGVAAGIHQPGADKTADRKSINDTRRCR